jgi:glycosyltransferase involved in cell wall biosynthesis
MSRGLASGQGAVDGPALRRVRVRVFYQTDPAGPITGGIDAFIRGLVKASPPDIEISIVGVTTDPRSRPVGRWSNLKVGSTQVAFLPVAGNRDPSGRSRVPLSLKLTLGVIRHFRRCSGGCDILEFHRLEPILPFLRDPRPKTAFIHQDMEVIRNPQSDIRWKGLPRLYFALERRLMPSLSTVFSVHAEAVRAYRTKYPNLAARFRFTPTWMDPETFYPVDGTRKAELRIELESAMGLRMDDEILISVGRLDRQKDPMLLVDSFARINAARPRTRLVIVGDGVLRPALVERAAALGLDKEVVFAGLRSPGDVANLLRAADAYVLSSAYEGMPLSVLEALACGVPVVATAVGEVSRVVRHGVNGAVVHEHSPEAISREMVKLLSERTRCSGAPCTDAVRDYVPDKVLAPVYENYRVLAGSSHRH